MQTRGRGCRSPGQQFLGELRDAAVLCQCRVTRGPLTCSSRSRPAFAARASGIHRPSAALRSAHLAPTPPGDQLRWPPRARELAVDDRIGLGLRRRRAHLSLRGSELGLGPWTERRAGRRPCRPPPHQPGGAELHLRRSRRPQRPHSSCAVQTLPGSQRHDFALHYLVFMLRRPSITCPHRRLRRRRRPLRRQR